MLDKVVIEYFRRLTLIQILNAVNISGIRVIWHTNYFGRVFALNVLYIYGNI